MPMTDHFKKRTDLPASRVAIRGVVWLSVRRIITQIIITISNLILVRVLFPGDFGKYAIVQFIVTLAWVFADLGFGRALVQRKEEPTPQLLQSIWWVQVTLGLLVTGVLWLARGLAADYYSWLVGDWSRWFLPIAAAQVVLNLGGVSEALLERGLQYRQLTIVELVSLLITQVVGIIGSLMGWGGLALAWGLLIGRIVRLTILFLLGPWPWGIYFSWKELRKVASYGFIYQTSAWIGLLNGAVLPVFVGKVSGAEAVGLISWSSGVAALVTAYSSVIEQVLFPLVSRWQQHLEVIAKIWVKAARSVAAVTFLLGGLLFVLAREVIFFLYTPRWLEGLVSLQLATVQMVFGSLTAIAVAILLALGEVRFYRKMHLLWALLAWGLSVPLVVYFGFWGFNLAMVLGSLTGLSAWLKLKKLVHFSTIEIVGWPIIAMIALLGFTFGLKQLVPITSVFTLLGFGIVGLVVYVLVLFFGWRRLGFVDLIIVWRLVIQKLQMNRK